VRTCHDWRQGRIRSLCPKKNVANWVGVRLKAETASQLDEPQAGGDLGLAKSLAIKAAAGRCAKSRDVAHPSQQRIAIDLNAGLHNHYTVFVLVCHKFVLCQNWIKANVAE
jgi:hypothetical protein